MNEEIILNITHQVALLQINRPAARNALNWTAQETFAQAVAQVAADTAVRAFVITGTGDKAFCTGGDLKELSEHPHQTDGERLNRGMSAALQQLTELPIPVIAAVNGDAFGGGCEILTACDLRLAVDYARFGFAQVRNALTTGWGGTGRLVRLIGQSRAMELLLTGRPFSVNEAHHIGFIHRVVHSAEEITAVALAWAEELTSLPRHALAATKTLTQAAASLPLSDVYQLETALFTAIWPQADHLEAMAAFVEKRKPTFH